VAAEPAVRGLVKKALVALLVLGFAAGCGGDDDGGEEGSSLTGVPWILSGGLDVGGWEAAPPTATFTGDTVAGFTGCNRYTGGFTVDGDELELGMIASTQIACVPPADAVEREYLAALERVARWRSEDDALVLLDDEGAELLRYLAASPAGDWHASSIQTGTALASPLPGTEITARFADDGTLTGSAGCNRYRTTFTIDRGRIEIAPAAATKKACNAPAGVMDQEAAYLAALPTAKSYRLEGASLALLRADGTFVARFSRAAQMQ
jgi:heat shock protein HslJ